MCYSMVLANHISDYTSEEILSQCFTLGPYLLGLGVGSQLGDKTEYDKIVKTLFGLEWLSSFLLPFLPFIMTIATFSFISFLPFAGGLQHKWANTFLLSVAGILSLIIGTLGGAQLPLIIRASQKIIKEEFILAVNYMGPLFAGPAIILSNSLSFELSQQIGLIVTIQTMGLGVVIILLKKRLTPMILASIPLFGIIFLTPIYRKIDYLTAKASYLHAKPNQITYHSIKDHLNFLEKYGKLERKKTSYQNIDFFIHPGHQEIETDSNFVFYLNRRIQFNQFAATPYHETMFYTGINLLKESPKNILILGAGDGLLLKEIIKYSPQIDTTLVELDPEMIDWSKNHPIISLLNNDSLNTTQKNIRIIADDAIAFLRRNTNKEKFDLVFIDFPFPNGHELSKLYSYEFYKMVKKVIKDDSVIVLDMPIEQNDDGTFSKKTKSILETLHASGFNNQLLFGPLLTFSAVSLSSSPLKFDYQKFPKGLSLATKINLAEIISQDKPNAKIEKRNINSMFHPTL